MAASSILFIVCPPGCYLPSIWVVVRVRGFTMDASNVGFPVFCDPFVYMKPSEFHASWKGLIESPLEFHAVLGVSE